MSMRLKPILVGQDTQHHRKGDIFRAEVNLTVDGKLYAPKGREDVYIAIDEVHNELKRQIISLKEKELKKIRRGKR